MKFIDVIALGNGKYLKRYWNEFSGKREVIEIECSFSTYIEYRDKKKQDENTKIRKKRNRSISNLQKAV